MLVFSVLKHSGVILFGVYNNCGHSEARTRDGESLLRAQWAH